MKKILLFALLLLSVVPAFAEFNGSGYYRTQNATSGRYAYLLDNTGSYDTHTSSADVLALALYSGFLRASSDPASVFYYTLVSEDTRKGISTIDIAGQGTSIHKFLDAYMKMMKYKNIDGKMSYLLYGEKGGLVKYLGDISSSALAEEGYPSIDAQGSDRYWWVDPLSDASSASYFGIAPTLTAGGKYYYPLYAGFDFNAYSSGVKFHIISKVENGVAVIKPVSGVIPAATPVIVECSKPLATDNRLNIGPSGSKADVSGNKLGGVYFDNPLPTHYNRTKFDKNTMRILTVKDGKLAFYTPSDLDFLPRNQAYLKVPSGTEKDVKVMTEDEYVKYAEQLEWERNQVSAIALSQSSATLEKGESVTLTATTTPAKPNNPTLTWTSSNSAVATVNASGKVTAVAAGSATITVSSDNNVKATATIKVIVSPASISLDKTSVNLEKGASATLKATVNPSDCTDKSVAWTTDKTAVATVDANGKVTAVGAGSAVITAKTSNGKTATATVSVVVSPATITIDKSAVTLEKGATASLVATVGPSDCTDKSVSWSSDKTSVATVDANGKVTAVAAGSAVITAKTSNGKTAISAITVVVYPVSISIDRTDLTVEKGTSVSLAATVGPSDCTDKSVSWSSDKTSVATVDANGKVTAVGAGSAVITAKTSNGKTATAAVTVIVSPASVTIDKTDVSVIKGNKVTLKATVGPNDCTDKSVTWTSDNESVAVVSDSGVVTAVAGGHAVVTVTTSNGKTASANVTVEVPATGIKLNSYYIDVMVGSQYQLIATISPEDSTEAGLKWSSSDETVATVDSNGLVEVLQEGRVTVTVTTSNGLSSSCRFNAVTGVEELMASPEAEVYDLQGNRVSSMRRGQVYIIRLNGTSFKVTK